MTKAFYFFLLFSLCCTIGLNAQHALLIPYNDHGSWGYCDTLGNIEIEPAYEGAGFFRTWRIGDKRIDIGRINTKWGENLVNLAGELLLPEKLDFVHRIYSKDAPDDLFLVRRKGKYGIYQVGAGLIVDTKYDSLANPFSYSSVLLFRRKNDATYMKFSPETRLLENTNFVAMEGYYNQYEMVEIATTTDGKYFKLVDNEFVEISKVQFATYEYMGDMAVEEVPEDWNNSYYWRGFNKPTAEELGVDRTVDFRDYSRLSTLIEKYGFTKLIIAERDGQMGIVNALGEEILPFRYDRVSFVGNDSQVKLEKDGKYGRKILFTHYPVIEARYDVLRPGPQLRVSEDWVFATFYVELNGQKGYVGENAIEYFDWE